MGAGLAFAASLSLSAPTAVAQRELPISERPLQVAFAFDGQTLATAQFVDRTHAARVLLIQAGTIRLEAYGELPNRDRGWEARDLDLATSLQARGLFGLCPLDDRRTFYLDVADDIVVVIERANGDAADPALRDAFIAAAIAGAKQPQMLK